MTDFTVTPSPPWRVTTVPVDTGRVVRLHAGQVTLVLPALEAHKIGSALQAASGLNDEPLDLSDDDEAPTPQAVARARRLLQQVLDPDRPEDG